MARMTIFTSKKARGEEILGVYWARVLLSGKSALIEQENRRSHAAPGPWFSFQKYSRVRSSSEYQNVW